MPTTLNLDIDSKDSWILQRVVQFLAQNALQSIVPSLLVVLMFTILNRHDFMSSPILIGWSVSAILLAIVRLLHFFRLKHANSSVQRESWLKGYRGLTLMSGLIFGTLPLLFFDTASDFMQSLIVFVLIGMPAAAAGTHGVDSWTFRLFSLSIVIPSIGFFFASSNTDYTILAVLMILFLIVMDRSAARTRASLMENIELTYEMSYRATHDALVGLLNREELEHQFELRAPHARHGVAMLFLDLDNFKPLNDTLGHQAGDEALKRVADIIRTAIRSDDLAARLGGDEFALILFLQTEAEVQELAESILNRVNQLIIDDRYQGLSVSIGISFHTTTTGVGFSRLMRTADLALYDSKRAGKNQVHLRHFDEPEY
ncbi:sensor domain-containing diguanylate cyclase [Reinekea blandensis]|uniref:diguanylate cyclase n=1 Tax=Reinekea blandensis MED297 TaxID=314283 RepID=A4BG06_9GAMM|nr:GGDEF domain-containing protein [Reinekea blandensis]EAR09024.1 hypothetical protein MED297_04007 [Reinekea sp. MED297] [Reinekea blandensis MED297]